MFHTFFFFGVKHFPPPHNYIFLVIKNNLHAKHLNYCIFFFWSKQTLPKICNFIKKIIVRICLESVYIIEIENYFIESTVDKGKS